MVKKRVKKKVSKKKSKKRTRKSISVTPRTIKPQITGVERGLTENFVSLQKIMVDLSVKLSGLTSQISQLLRLFETSAKTLAEKEFKEDKKVTEKLDKLIEQNKIIAKGLTLLHDTPYENEEIPEVSKLQSINPIQNAPQSPPQTSPEQPTVIQNTPQSLPPKTIQSPPLQTPQQPPVIQDINSSETTESDRYQKSIVSTNKPIKSKTFKPLQPRTSEEEFPVN